MTDRVHLLREPATIRERCGRITRHVDAGESPHFRLDRSRMPDVAARIAALTRERFPDGHVPFHSRWRHFEAGGVDRKAELDAALAGRSSAAVARARIDLALVSVLLDAGAGPAWTYREAETGRTFARSEGLGVASLRAFLAGRFSSDPGDPCRVDARALGAITAGALAEVFQASADNPLVGLDGRASLLRRLGTALREQPAIFSAEGQPGHLFDALTHRRHAPALHHHRPQPTTQHHAVGAGRILRALLDAFSAIWPSGQVIDGVPMGDVWPHPVVEFVPFHKLSQWLTYSLLEPFQWAGIDVHGLDDLTGLPEYRNGGLFLDAGVIVPREAAFTAVARTPADPAVIEWRALTVSLLDEVAPMVREALGLSTQQMPLACVLEGGSWAAGRQIAAERRPGGGPPLTIDSDGTLF